MRKLMMAVDVLLQISWCGILVFPVWGGEVTPLPGNISIMTRISTKSAPIYTIDPPKVLQNSVGIPGSDDFYGRTFITFGLSGILEGNFMGDEEAGLQFIYDRESPERDNVEINEYEVKIVPLTKREPILYSFGICPLYSKPIRFTATLKMSPYMVKDTRWSFRFATETRGTKTLWVLYSPRQSPWSWGWEE